MVKKTKGKHRLDKFYHLAKEQGYRSRAAFKLIQLNRKYDFLSGARTLLDLCAAPGGWCQVAVKTMPVGSTIIAVDLMPIRAIRGVKTIVGDITTQQCRQMIRKEAGDALMDVVLHDGAPNVGGAWSSEAYAQSWLVLESLRMATDMLAPQGTFVTKIFRSKDYTALLYAFNQLFAKVEATKPAASRNASAEIFVVCRGYKAPARIDPRLLDAKYLFQEVTDLPKAAGPDALIKAKIKQQRFREGYEEGMSIARKVTSAIAFVVGQSPIEVLGQVTAIALVGADSEVLPEGIAEDIKDPAGAAEFLRSHSATSDEIKLLLKDLQVIGRSEFKALLKWRLAVRKDLMKHIAASNAGNAIDISDGKSISSDADADRAEEDRESEEEEGEESRIMKEMEDIKDRLHRREKREKKRKRELKTKARLRAAQLAQAEGLADGEEDRSGPDGLFSLAQIPSKDVQVSDDIDDDNEKTLSDSETEEGEEDIRSTDGSESSDGDGYDGQLDEYLEESYKAWKTRQRMKDASGGVLKKKRRRLGMDGELEEEEEEGDEEDRQGDGAEDDSEDEEEVENGLLVSLDEPTEDGHEKRDAATEQWFAQELFDDDDLTDEPRNVDSHRRQRQAMQAKEEIAEDGDTALDVQRQETRMGKKKEKKTKNDVAGEREAEEDEALRRAFARDDRNGNANGFEVVPLSDSDGGGDSDAEEFEALSDDAKAEVLALAKRFLRRKDKEELMEAAYNRFSFHDTNLPKWFAEDEHKYMRPAPQLSAAELAEARERLRAVDARPIKKVVEAKARKRKRLAAKLSQARQKAEAIAGQEDMPMSAKLKEIEKLYAKARSGGSGGGGKKGKNKKTGRGDRGKRKGPPLDRRMKKDKRGMEVAAKRLKKKSGKRGRK